MSGVEEAEKWLEGLERAVERHGSDCKCQAGGVDAMSIDHDWMRMAVRKIKAGWTTLHQDAP